MRLRASLPGVTLAAVGVLVTGGIWWGSADLVAGSTPQNRAARLVPADGTRVFARDGDGVLTTETALLSGAQLVSSSPASIGGAILLARHTSIAGLHAWRATSTSSAAVSGSTQATTLRAVTERGIEQMATYGPFTLVFTPALLEVPADVHPGSTWSSDGTARPDDSINYRSTWESAAVPGRDMCVRITGTIAFTDKNGAKLTDSASDETWCDGLGGATTTTAAPPTPPAFTGPTLTSPVNLADVGDWRSALVPAATNDAFFGAEPYVAQVDVRPVRLYDYTLVLPEGSAHDVVGLTTPETTLQKQWVGHPGGVITALGAVGSVSVVGTSARTISGYGPYGGWLWTRSFGDVPATPPLDIGTGLAAVTTLDGHVEVLRAATGETVWAADLPTEIREAPVSDGHRLVVADRSGDTVAFDLVTGKRVWDSHGDVVGALAVHGGVLVTLAGDAVRGVSLVDGRDLWSRPVDGSSVAVGRVGAVVVVTTSDESLGLDPATGVVRWRAPGAEQALALGTTLFELVGDAVVGRDAGGAQVGRWTMVGLTAGSARYLVPSPTGIDIVDGDGHLVRIAP